MKKFLLTTALLFGAASANAATLTTLADENGRIGNFGLVNTAFYGQTITLDAATSLNNVIFSINDYGKAISFDVFVLAYDSATDFASGANLAGVSGTTAGDRSFSDVDVATGGIGLDAGEWLIGFQATTKGRSDWGTISNGSLYADGGFVFQNNSGDISDLTLSVFDDRFAHRDLAFEFEFDAADISAVPLPASLPLLLAGFGALGIAGRRRKA